jgi:hypothetical protein
MVSDVNRVAKCRLEDIVNYKAFEAIARARMSNFQIEFLTRKYTYQAGI